MNGKVEFVNTDFGWSVVGASPSLLAQLLVEFESEVRRAGVSLDSRPAPGIASDRTVEALTGVGLVCPEELKVWFEWHDGPGPELGGRFTGFLPFVFPATLQWSVDSYIYSMREMVPDGLWKPGWLSLEDVRGLVIWCGTGQGSSPRVRKDVLDEYDFLEDDNKHQVVSLCTVVAWWLEAIERGAAIWSETDHKWNYDFAQLAEIDKGTWMLR